MLEEPLGDRAEISKALSHSHLYGLELQLEIGFDGLLVVFFAQFMSEPENVHALTKISEWLGNPLMRLAVELTTSPNEYISDALVIAFPACASGLRHLILLTGERVCRGFWAASCQATQKSPRATSVIVLVPSSLQVQLTKIFWGFTSAERSWLILEGR